jgi:carboxypeptidase Taq
MTSSDKDTDSNYQSLLEKAKQVVVLETAQGIIHWDMETMMPPMGIRLRSEQLGLLSKIAHKMTTDAEIGELLRKL